MTSDSFRKSKPGVGPDYYRAEAAGLDWLRVTGGPPIPALVAENPDGLELARIGAAAPTPGHAYRLGVQLAAMHSAGAASFGEAPPGAPATGYIADLPMPYGDFGSFGIMYSQLRIAPFVERAGSIFGAKDVAVFDELRERLEAEDPAVVGAAEPPARIHGDLWSGNVLWGVHGAWLIDPAACGGHRESDLAMLALFGAPHLDDIIDGYEAAAPLARGWRDRVALHQVYPLLVHTCLFGGGYAHSAVAAAVTATS